MKHFAAFDGYEQEKLEITKKLEDVWLKNSFKTLKKFRKK
jgi:hypothetical protein